MPPGNVWLVDFPAQVDDFFAAKRKKIHQAEVHIFDDATMGLNFLYQPDQAHLGVAQVIFIGVNMRGDTGFGSHAPSSLRFEQSYSHLAPSLQQLGDEGS
jgi:hypothetical protein